MSSGPPAGQMTVRDNDQRESAAEKASGYGLLVIVIPILDIENISSDWESLSVTVHKGKKSPHLSETLR